MFYPFAKRLNLAPAPGERLRVERMLAGARLFLALASLIAIFLDSTEPTRYDTLAYGLMFAYLAHSAVTFLWLRRSQQVSTRFAVALQAIDIAWPALIGLFTEGPNSPFFLLFFFTLVAAAFRWGLRATLATASLGVVLVLGEAALLTYSGGATRLVVGQFDVNRLIMRTSYLMMMGLLIGLAAEEEKQLRAENQFIARLADKVHTVEGSLSGAMQEVFGEILRTFRAQRALAVMRELATGRVHIWDAQLLASGHASVQLSEAPFERREELLFPLLGDAWHASLHPAEQGTSFWQYSALDAEGHTLRQPHDFRPPAGVSVLQQCSSLMGVRVDFGESWSGRVLLLEPRLHASIDTELRFLQNLLQQVGPAIYNLYLVRRLRSRAEAIERARAARELHDGAIQSLISAEMQVDVLRRKSATAAPGLIPELERVQDLLRQEVLSLRELMQQMKPVDVGPTDLVQFLAEGVDRFRRDSGIAARFTSDVDEVPLPGRVCREIARIAQEALVNVRKHSGARNVAMRFQSDSGRWLLRVEDDGRGFAFSGRMAGAELERAHCGPAILHERVRSIGGELMVESEPGKGARLEITLPQNGRITYA